MAPAPVTFFRSIERAALAVDQAVHHLTPAVMPGSGGAGRTATNLSTAAAQVRESVSLLDEARAVTRDAALRDAVTGSKKQLVEVRDALSAGTAPKEELGTKLASVRAQLDQVTEAAHARNAAAPTSGGGPASTSPAAAPGSKGGRMSGFAERHPTLAQFMPLGVVVGLFGGIALLGRVFGDNSPRRDPVIGARPSEPVDTAALAARILDTYDAGDDGTIDVSGEEYKVKDDSQTKAARRLLIDADRDTDGQVDHDELLKLVDRFDDGSHGSVKRNSVIEPGEMLVLQQRYSDARED